MPRTWELERAVIIIRNWLHETRATWGFVILLFIIYAMQLAVAGSLEWSAAYTAVRELRQSLMPVLVLLSPLFHSNHGHIVSNVVVIFTGGVLVERRVGPKRWFAFVYLCAYFANILPVFLGGLGIGASGAGFGLSIFVGLEYARLCKRELDRMGVMWTRSVWFGSISGIGLFWGLLPVFQVLGVFPLSGATVGHFVGTLGGIVWFWLRT